MPDTVFAVVALIELALIGCMAMVWANDARKRDADLEIMTSQYAERVNDAILWQEAYEAKSSQAEQYLGQIAALEAGDAQKPGPSASPQG